ncbi:hypothetical protein CAPTEDRAFT_187474 [Capitella teleta]|uniref:NR LBD domain-containing protein n=1 Tax=Capitella teleta TaxID=283909 RepID=R7TPR8_CAPTE|nr:hypothetical protein CAPTEDRAFT_215511 [Capitella teleta]ELU17333.1 hypothetical protein CAPTEDRAFT_187474 [Capitella teleta]|eukprot:ELT95858.1 hypothetical protein CAPTEDRAFT_215511 [Capitella teleta]
MVEILNNKAARFDNHMVLNHQYVNTEFRLAFFIEGVVLDESMFQKVHNQPGLPDKVAILMARLQRLKLTKEESALFAALLVFLTDRAGELQALKQIHACQELILEALLFYLEKTYPEEPLRVAHLISLATDMRDIKLSDECLKWTTEIDIELPKLFKELWT